MNERFYVRIGNVGSDAGIEHRFDQPQSLWDKWNKIEFEFRANNGNFQTTNVKVIPGKMIWVKERWFHRLWSWLYFKFKKPIATQAGES